MPVDQKPSVIIVGAGASGLMAAQTLAPYFEVTVLEALDRVGGRIYSMPSTEKDTLLDAGAEFMHGALPLTTELLKEAGLHKEKITGSMYNVNNCEWKEQDELVEGWDVLLDRMKSLQHDITLDGFLEIHFSDPKYEALRRRARAFAAGFDLADPTKVSAMALFREWSQESEDQYHIREGYGALVDHLYRSCIAKGCRILTHKKIKKVHWLPGEATALTSEGEQFTANKIIVTLPAGVMQKTANDYGIGFSPTIEKYDAAWQNIGYGSVLKVLLMFSSPFWEETKNDIGFILSDEAIPTWWPRSGNILTGWVGGPSAVQWDEMYDEDILVKAIQSLCAIFRKEAGELTALLQDHHVLRWHKLPAACGAYSYETPLSAEARILLKTPVENTLYFAGEALYTGPYPGTVEAALVDGKGTAERIITSAQL